eukprot:PhF_6_TR8456/c0_g1_i1/m.13200
MDTTLLAEYLFCHDEFKQQGEGGEKRPLLHFMLTSPTTLDHVRASCGYEPVLLGMLYKSWSELVLSSSSTTTPLKITITFQDLALPLQKESTQLLETSTTNEEDTRRGFVQSICTLLLLPRERVEIHWGGGSTTITTVEDILSQLIQFVSTLTDVEHSFPHVGILLITLHYTHKREATGWVSSLLNSTRAVDSTAIVRCINEYSTFLFQQNPLIAQHLVLRNPDVFGGGELLYGSDRDILCDVIRRERRDCTDPHQRATLTRILYVVHPLVKPPVGKGRTTQDVRTWLLAMQLCDDYEQMVFLQGLDGEVIGGMSEAEWEECGVESAYDRHRIMEELRE